MLGGGGGHPTCDNDSSTISTPENSLSFGCRTRDPGLDDPRPVPLVQTFTARDERKDGYIGNHPSPRTTDTGTHNSPTLNVDKTLVFSPA